MKLSKEEQEVHISFSAVEDNAVIYTSYPPWMRKLDKLASQNPASFQCLKSDRVSRTYAMPKELISIRSRKRAVSLTEEQKEQIAKRLHESK